MQPPDLLPTVRRAGPSDAAVAAEMLHAFNTEFDTPTPPPHVLAERLRALLARDELVLLLAGEPPAGLALLSFRPTPWEPGPLALLEELYVRPALRGRRTGHALLEAAMALAAERGTESFEINVDEGDVDARRFYAAHGFADRDPDTGERALYSFRRLSPADRPRR